MARDTAHDLARSPAALALLAAVVACSDPRYGPPPIESITAANEASDGGVGDDTFADAAPTEPEQTQTSEAGPSGLDSDGQTQTGEAPTSSGDEATSAGMTAALSTSDGTTGDAISTSWDGTAGADSTGDGGDGGSAFPDPATFGDDVQELDLVGTWGLNWDPAGGSDSVLDIDPSGEFVWSESSADCATTTLATGVLWVESTQVVLHVETWERPLPWDTEAVLGEAYPPPFRMRMSFSLQGGASAAYLALAAPSRVTQNSPYTGESYVRTAQQGEHLGGTWHGEAELLAIPVGEAEPVVIVRDSYDAFLDPENDPLDPEGTGTRAVTTQYFPVPASDTVYDGANWTCLGGCPLPAGATLVDGSNLYTYGPYAGQQHLMPLADDRTFLRDVVSDCP